SIVPAVCPTKRSPTRPNGSAVSAFNESLFQTGGIPMRIKLRTVGPASRRSVLVGPASRRSVLVGPASRRSVLVGPASRRSILVRTTYDRRDAGPTSHTDRRDAGPTSHTDRRDAGPTSHT